MSSPLSLYRLQQVDSQIDQVTTRLETIDQMLEDDQELHQIKSSLTDAEAVKKAARKDLSKIEAEAESQKAKIEQSEAGLYSGNVKNPKELQDLQNELSSLKRHLETLEDRQLEAMLASDSAEAVEDEVASSFSAAKQRLAQQNRELTGEQAALQKDLERLQSERTAVVAENDSKTLSMYEQLRQERRGVAVVTITDGACDACGTTLTPAQQQAARSTTKITFCPTCGRILYTN